jgi:host factor-I protein
MGIRRLPRTGAPPNPASSPPGSPRTDSPGPTGQQHTAKAIPIAMPSKPPTAEKKKSRPQEQTFEEPKYLKQLIDKGTRVCLKLINNEELCGVIEYYDHSFIRLTRENEPNLFVFKHEIKYLFELE